MNELDNPWGPSSGSEGPFHDMHLGSATTNNLGSCEWAQLESKACADTMGKCPNYVIPSFACAEIDKFLPYASFSVVVLLVSTGVVPLLCHERYTDVGLGQTLLFGSLMADGKGSMNCARLDTYSDGCFGPGNDISTTSNALCSQEPDQAALYKSVPSLSLTLWQITGLEAAEATLATATDDSAFPSKNFYLGVVWRKDFLGCSIDLPVDGGVNIDEFLLCITRSPIKCCPAQRTPPKHRGGARDRLAVVGKGSGQGKANKSTAPNKGDSAVDHNTGNNADGDDDDDDDDDDEDNGNGKRNGNDNSKTKDERSLRCHFFVFNPELHARCRKFAFNRWSDLMQHFTRRHCNEIEFYCPKCYLGCDTARDLDAHINACVVLIPEGPNQFYPEELDALKNELKCFRRQDVVAKWNWLWKRCFKNEDPPSPYPRSMLTEYADIFRRRNSSHLRNVMRNIIEGAGINDESLINHYLEITLSAAYDVVDDGTDGAHDDSGQPAERPSSSWCFRNSSAALPNRSNDFGIGSG